MDFLDAYHLWADAHEFYGASVLPGTPESAGLTAAWETRLAEETPNGALLRSNALFDALINNTTLHLLHVTHALEEISEHGVLYPSGGCLVGSIYCAPLTPTGEGLRMHNLAAYVLNREAPAFRKETTDVTADTLAWQIAELLRRPTTTHGLARALRAAAKELDVHRTHMAALKAWPDGRIDDAPRKVQIGGGAHRIDGYFNIDAVPPADLLWDVREGIPLHDNTVHDLFSEHFLEHIDYPHSAKHYARDAHRVLAPGGRVVTGVPDAGFVLSRYPSGDTDTQRMIKKWYGRRNCLDHINTHLDLVNYVFRDQDDDPVYHPHYWAYDHDKLVQLFTEAGFATVEPWEFDPTIANPKREWASVYVVATK